MSRGRKLKTVENSPRGTADLIHRDSIESPSDLSEAAQIEYRRLCDVLDSRGTFTRIDLAVVAECARIKAELDRAYKLNSIMFDPKIVNVIGTLTSQRRGLLREMGLSILPSRSVIKSVAKTPQSQEAIGPLIKIAE